MNLNELKVNVNVVLGKEPISFVGSMVKHFKGDYYLVEGIAQNCETNEPMVVYKGLYGDCPVYVRPLTQFLEKCTEEQFRKYGQEYRFEVIKMESVRER